MGDRSLRRRRVIIEDARRNGHHLRATWHAERRQFVISTWRDDVCTGSARLAVEDAAELTSLLVDGVTQAVVLDRDRPPPMRATRPGLAGLVDRLRWFVRGTPPRRPTSRARSRRSATVETLPRRSA
ncbi:MAG: hypothetical protein ACLFXM_10760 [Acidimicrobiia bacterium]